MKYRISFTVSKKDSVDIDAPDVGAAWRLFFLYVRNQERDGTITAARCEAREDVQP